MATAMPRRRQNQKEMSARIGPKLAEQPIPMSAPWTRANTQRFDETEAARKPIPSSTPPPRATGMMP